MKSNKISDALAHIDDELISDAMEYKRKSKKAPVWVRISAVAACVLILCMGGYLLWEAKSDIFTPYRTPLTIPPSSNHTMLYLNSYWPGYNTYTEIAAAASNIYYGNITDISFEILDSKGNTVTAPPQEENIFSYSIYTIYTVRVTKALKGSYKESSHVKFAFIGGFPGYKEDEQNKLLMDMGLVDKEGEIIITSFSNRLIEQTDETYLFCTKSGSGKYTQIINPDQYAYPADSAGAKTIERRCHAAQIAQYFSPMTTGVIIASFLLCISMFFIIKTRKGSQPKRCIAWVAAGTVTACLILYLGIGYKTENPFPIKTLPTSSSGEIAPVLPWEEMEIYQKYSVINTDSIEYSIRKGDISTDNIAEKLYSATAEGWENKFDGSGDFIEHIHEAEIYRINGISPECAVAVKYIGDAVYYPAVNSYYKPEALSDFVNGLNLRDNLLCGFASQLYKKKLSGKYVTVYYEDVDIQRLWELLDSSTDAPNVFDEATFMQPRDILTVSVSIPLLGYENFSVSIKEGGLVWTNLLDTGKMFYVGEEGTNAFVEYVTESCPGYEIRFETENAVPVIPE